MPTELVLQRTANDAAVLARREQLAALRVRLAEREAELGRLRAQLKAFETQYFCQVGVLYAELDDLEARIAEREVALYDSAAARQRAVEARQRAQETHDAAFCGDEADVEAVVPTVSLKTLFREVVKRIHPDRATDDAEERYFTLLMARANHAYHRGDTDALQRLLDDHAALYTATVEDGFEAQLQRLSRQVQQVQRDLAVLDAEHYTLLTGDIGQLHQEAEAAAREQRNLLTELAARVREQIDDATRRFTLVDRQIDAHGR